MHRKIYVIKLINMGNHNFKIHKHRFQYAQRLLFKTLTAQHIHYQKLNVVVCKRINYVAAIMNFEMSRILLVFLLGLIAFGKVASYPGGASVYQYESMQPGSRHGQAQTTPSPYLIIQDMIEYQPFVPVSSKLKS